MEVAQIQPWSYHHYCSAPLALTEFSLMRWRVSHDPSSSVFRILLAAVLIFFIYYPLKFKRTRVTLTEYCYTFLRLQGNIRSFLGEIWWVKHPFHSIYVGPKIHGGILTSVC